MSPLSTSLVVFACVFSGALLGVFFHRLLPEPHLSPESRDVVRLGMGLVATTVAVALGLLVASSKGFYDTQNAEITQLAANTVALDRVLAHYGPDATEARAALRLLVTHLMDLMISARDSSQNNNRPLAFKGELILDKLQDLSPKDDNQSFLRAQALSLAFQMGQTRWLMFEQ